MTKVSNGVILYVKQVGFKRAKEVAEASQHKWEKHGSSYIRTRQVAEVVKSLQLMEDYFNVNSLGNTRALELAEQEYTACKHAGMTTVYNRYSNEAVSLRRLSQAIEHFKLIYPKEAE